MQHIGSEVIGRSRSRDTARMAVIAALPRESRLMRQIRRRLIAADGKPVTTRELRDWCYREPRYWHCRNIRRSLKTCGYAKPVGHIGRMIEFREAHGKPDD